MDRAMDDESGSRMFEIGKSRYDQKLFSGRLRHFLDVVDPRTLFTSEKRLAKAVKLLDDYRQGKIGSEVTDEQLWQAQKIKQAIIHPDTGQKILPPFRMSGFVPFGSITVIGLLLPNQSFGQMIFWQWINQSHNACVNYANRNASKPTPTSRFVLGYVGAVSSAITIAVSLSSLLRRAQTLNPVTKKMIERFVPFPAVATASVLNAVLMRNHELSEGIDVSTEDGEIIGTSKIAAKKAVLQTAVTRFVLPAPILIIPPIILTQVEKLSLWSKYPRLRLPIHASICTLCFGLALPAAIALFPQQAKVQTSHLEEDIQLKTSEAYVYYNKGL